MNFNAIPKYNPNKKLCIDALLACAFARSQKMMRFVAGRYDANKESYYKAAQSSDHFGSRFITGSRNAIRLNAIQALGVIMVAKTDDDLARDMLQAAEKAFKKIANKISSYDGRAVNWGSVFEAAGVFDSGQDDLLHDTMALSLYFCQQYQAKTNETDPMYQQLLAVVIDKDEAFLRPFQDIAKDVAAKHSTDVAELMKATIAVCGGAKSVAELGSRLEVGSVEFSMFQILWDIAQLDNIPMSSYENEKFTRQELMDLFNTMYIHILRGEFAHDDVNKYYIMGLILRSMARLYKESSGIIDQYAGIIRESDRYQELQRELTAAVNKAEELTKLNAEKQERLNKLQMDLDRQQMANATLQEEIELYKERVAILEALDEEEAAPAVAISEEKLAKVRAMKGVVFGGPPNWQSTIQNAAPKFSCVPVEDRDFDVKLIDKAEVIVIKTDYLSHAQWYRVVRRAKAKGKKIVYCRNNVELVFRKIGELV